MLAPFATPNSWWLIACGWRPQQMWATIRFQPLWSTISALFRSRILSGKRQKYPIQSRARIRGQGARGKLLPAEVARFLTATDNPHQQDTPNQPSPLGISHSCLSEPNAPVARLPPSCLLIARASSRSGANAIRLVPWSLPWTIWVGLGAPVAPAGAFRGARQGRLALQAIRRVLRILPELAGPDNAILHNFFRGISALALLTIVIFAVLFPEPAHLAAKVAETRPLGQHQFSLGKPACHKGNQLHRHFRPGPMVGVAVGRRPLPCLSSWPWSVPGDCGTSEARWADSRPSWRPRRDNERSTSARPNRAPNWSTV